MFDACVDAAAAGATLGEIARAIRIHDSPCSRITPVCLVRAATGFECLRAAVQKVGPPSVFLCNMGGLPDDERARISRAASLLSAATTSSRPKAFALPKTLPRLWRVKSENRGHLFNGRKISRPCAAPGPGAPRATKRRHHRSGWIASGPGRSRKKAGVDEFIHVRADALELLTAFHRRLGIEL